MGGIQKGSDIHFFEDKPLFGLDIGQGTLRVMQLDPEHKAPRLKGYGSTAFDPTAIADGVIVKPEILAKATLHLFKKTLVGDISTSRVAVSVPANRAFTRVVQLPKISPNEIAEAVRSEAEQYLPGHAENLYLDYSILKESDEGIEILIVAMPKKIVDSYLALTRMLGLEAVLIDTSIGASARLFALDAHSNVPALLIDFGSNNTDLAIFNRGVVVLGTAAFGGEDITKSISRYLGVTPSEALVLKSRYGLAAGPAQKQITAAIEPSLDMLMREIRRTIRYYEQRYSKEQPINQIIAMGGGANMPGLSDYLTDRLRLPTRVFDCAPHIDFDHMRPFYKADRASYVTAAGLALINPEEIFV